MALFRTLAAAAVATAVSGMASAQTMGAGPDALVTHNLGYVIAGVTSQSAGLGITVQQYDGSQHLALTDSGDIAFSLSNIQELRAAISGTEQFEGSALPNLRAVARLIDMRVGLFVPFDSEVKSIADLAGKRVPVGYGSQATERVAMIALLAAGGLTPADVEQVEVKDTGEAMVAFREDRLDVMMGTVFDHALIEVDRAVGGTRGLGLSNGLRILAIPDDLEAAAAMTTALPGASIVITSPLEGRPDFERTTGTHLPGIGEEVRTMSYDILLAASTETDEDLVYKVVKALATNRNAFFITGEPQYLSFSKDTMVTHYDGVDYHPGAIRYYEEAGLWQGN